MAHIACLHCDLLMTSVELDKSESAVCPRCHQSIYLEQRSFHTSLALLLTAILVYFPSILLPFLSMQTAGRSQQVSLLKSIIAIANGEMLFLAITVFLLVIVFPLIKIVGLLSIIFPLSQNRLPFFGVTITRYLLRSSPWSMVEVYLVGVLVTLVKLTGIATVDFSNGFYAFILLIIINAMISINLPQKRIWQMIAHLKNSPLTIDLTRKTTQK